MAATPIRIVLALEPDHESLTGRVSCDGQPAREFTGWLGLLGALQALLPDGRPSGREQRGMAPGAAAHCGADQGGADQALGTGSVEQRNSH